MIPSLDHSDPVMRRTPDWPDGPQPHSYPSGALFETRPPLRQLVVLADADLLAAPSDFTVNPKVLLSGLLTHPYIKLLRYRDDGPPADAPREGNAAKGWAELLPPDDQEGRDLVYAHVSEQPV